MPLADTLLRLAAKRLYLARWTDEILAEVVRNLIEKFGKTQEQADYREGEMRRNFPEALVEGYEELVPVMKNHTKDRHVLAAAVRSGSEKIITYNSRDFPASALEPYDIAAIGPSTFLWDLYELEPEIVVLTLKEQADKLGQTLESLLKNLHVNVPTFVDKLREKLKEQGDPTAGYSGSAL